MPPFVYCGLYSSCPVNIPAPTLGKAVTASIARIPVKGISFRNPLTAACWRGVCPAKTI